MDVVELVNEPHPPIPWVVEGLLRPGLIGLAAGSSDGKSTLLRDMVTSVVLGENVFGYYDVPQPATVVYCVTEEEKADIARELERQFAIREAPLSPNLHVFTDFPAADGGGLDELEELVSDLQPQLVIMDLFSDFQQVPTNYNRARPVFHAWNVRAKEWGIALLGTMHAYRGGIPLTGPWMAKMQGSVGAPGAMTVRLGLARFPAVPRSLLRVTGKGTRDHDLELEFDPDTNRFRAADAPTDNLTANVMGVKRMLIMEVVLSHMPAGIAAPALATAVRALAEERHAPVEIALLTYDNLRQMLHQMAHNPNVSLVRRDGLYFATESAGA